MRDEGDRTLLSVMEMHLEDLEAHAVETETLLEMEKLESDQAKALAHAQGQELQLHEDLRQNMEHHIAQLQQESDAKDVLIAALQAQLQPPPPPSPPPPPPPHSSDEDSSDDEDDNGNDEEGGAPTAEEEEDPEELIFDISDDDDEDYDASNDEDGVDDDREDARGKKRKCTKSTNFIKRSRK
jgi:hypothetical protein